MKIVFCKNSFAGPISGADEIAVAYATELKAAGHAPRLLLVQPPSDRDPLAERLRAANVPLDTLASTAVSSSLATARRVAIGAMRTFPLISDLILSHSRRVLFNLVQQYHEACCEYLRRNRPDVVHVLTPDPGAVMLIRAAHATGIPVIYQEVGIPFHPPGFEEVYERFVSVLPLCDEVAVLSPSLGQEFQRVVMPFSSTKVLPLISFDHNGVTTRPPSEIVTFGFAARLEHLKGPIRLLEAFRIAGQTSSNMELKLAGEGSQRQEFIDTSRRLGLQQKCHLTGVYRTLEERGNFMSSVDVFVLPSLTEGTPNAIIEAMAHGKPIIANAVGGVPDLVTEDVGILVPPNDSHALAAAMSRMSLDAQMRQRMGAAARLKYEQLFTPEAVMPVLLDFYEQLIDRHSANARSNNKRYRRRVELVHPWVSPSYHAAVDVVHGGQTQ